MGLFYIGGREGRCGLSMFVSDALGDHMVEAYSSMGLVMALYVASMVSLCCPTWGNTRQST